MRVRRFAGGCVLSLGAWRTRLVRAASLAAAWFATSAGPAAAEGVTVALLPAEQVVAPGEEFQLDLYVTEAGSPFNAFDAGIGYDGGALTFLPTSPTSLQQGVYMTSACGNTFHLFSTAGDSLIITDVLLCLGVSLPGPGQIYRLRFRASETPQVTRVRIDSIQFYDAGLYVNPARRSDAVIGIGVPLDSGSPPSAGGRLRLRAMPNPSAGGIALCVESEAVGEQALEVFDVHGRLVQRLQRGTFSAGARTVVWNGAGADGMRLRPGVYVVRLRSALAAAEVRVTLLD